MNRDYNFVPDGMEVLHVDTRAKFKFFLNYTKKPRVKITVQEFKAQDFEEKGLKTNGIRLESKEVDSIKVEDSGLQTKLDL